MDKPENVSDYDPNAPLPKPKTPWVWEPEKDHAVELVWVVEVLWNGEQWWIKTRGLRRPEPFDRPALNEVSRWWEAVAPVTWTPEDNVMHRPDLAVAGRPAGVRWVMDDAIEEFEGMPA